MTKPSAMLRYAELYAQQKNASAQLLMAQYMTDTLQIAIHQSEGWGYDRIKRLTVAWEQVQREYKAVMDPKDPEADVMQEHMDRVMAQIIGNRQELVPFEERYPELKRHRTGKN